MQRILEHTKLVGELKENQIDLKFIKCFKIEDLFKCCYNLKNRKLSSGLYFEREAIQKELIRDEKFVEYLIQIDNEKILPEMIQSLVECIQNNNKNVSDYEIKTLIETLKNKNFNHSTYYDYLEYFSSKVENIEEKNIVAANLAYFHSQKKISMSELSEDERSLFIEPFMSDYNLIPITSIKKVCELLVQDNELRNIIHFLFSNNQNVVLDIEEYELLHQHSKSIYEYICKIVKMINNEQMYELLLRWIENGCTIYDLKILENKLQDLEKWKMEKIFCNRSSYVNFIFGNKLSDFPLENISERKEKLLIYAISNKKKRFLQLLEENSNDFLSIDDNSILFNEKFYKKYININTLTQKNIIDLKSIISFRTNIYYLEPNNYTFEEIKLLYNVNEPYLTMYNNLLDMKVDDRLLIIKQLLKRQLLHGKKINDEEIKRLANKLKEKHLYQWMEADFSHIKELKVENVIDILINYNDIKKFISQISNQKELLYILRNIEKIQEYKNLDEIKENIEKIDRYWKELVKYMNFSNEFIEKNKGHIRDFLLNNGAELALSYYQSNDSAIGEAFKKIVKAELMGKFKKLKYYPDDLKKEIDFSLADYQIKEWTENNMIVKEEMIEVKEYDDFYNTMVLGEVPERTCLSYKNGAYHHCLLACFDSNKKILYAKINDKVIARAMVRLTKGKYYNIKTKQKQTFSFIDLENMQEQKVSKGIKEIKNEEFLTIFLEKPYVSGISKEEEKKVKKIFIKLLEKKAVSMNALLVLSSQYLETENENYIVTKYNMYISKSKAGSQYLDSLNGQATIMDEGQYKENTFMIWQSDKKAHSL